QCSRSGPSYEMYILPAQSPDADAVTHIKRPFTSSIAQPDVAGRACAPPPRLPSGYCSDGHVLYGRPRSRSPSPTALCPLLTICQRFYIMSAYTLTNIMVADKSTSASLDRALTLLNDALAPQVLVHYGDASIDSRHPDAGWLELEWLPYSKETPHRQRLRVVVTSDASNATSIADTMWILQGSVPATLRDQLRER